MSISPKLFNDYPNVEFIPPDERWGPPYDDNVVREDRDEYFVTAIARSCDDPNCKQGNCNEHSGHQRDYRSVRVTRNFETQTFVLYLGGESILTARWADTPSGRGPNGHYRMLMKVKMFAKGWMAAEDEIPVRDIHVHSGGPAEQKVTPETL